MIKFLDLDVQLNERKNAGLYRQQLTLDSAQQVEIKVEGRDYLNFASNDYLGLANSELAQSALQDGLAQFGFGSGASHLVCGHQLAHQQFETAIAALFERSQALGFGSGYMANLGLLQSLCQKGDLILADKLNHASLIDGARLSEAEHRRYQHCDVENLEWRLSRASQNTFVVTDSVFSMDGDLAPLDKIADLCDRYNAVLIVDDAHGFGVLGPQGKGAVAHFGLDESRVPVLMTTLGKALGGYGAVISGAPALIDFLRQTARPYIYTTAIPAIIAAANQANLELLQKGDKLREKLAENISFFRQQAIAIGLNLLPSATPIQPVLVGSNQKVIALREHLLQHQLLVGAIRSPTVAVGSERLRITITAAHSRAQILQLIDALASGCSAL